MISSILQILLLLFLKVFKKPKIYKLKYFKTDSFLINIIRYFIKFINEIITINHIEFIINRICYLKRHRIVY